MRRGVCREQKRERIKSDKKKKREEAWRVAGMNPIEYYSRSIDWRKTTEEQTRWLIFINTRVFFHPEILT